MYKIRALETEIMAHKLYFEENRRFVCEAVARIANR